LSETQQAPIEETSETDGAVDETSDGARTTPTRAYVVLEQGTFSDDEQPYWTEVGRVEARNAQNALRKAFRDIKGDAEGDTVFCVIPDSMWRPTPVAARRRADITISVGAD